MTSAVCPICQRSFERETSPAVPFCSRRCRQIDLGRWLSESYVVPGRELEPDELPDVPESPESRDSAAAGGTGSSPVDADEA